MRLCHHDLSVVLVLKLPQTLNAAFGNLGIDEIIHLLIFHVAECGFSNINFILQVKSPELLRTVESTIFP